MGKEFWSHADTTTYTLQPGDQGRHSPLAGVSPEVTQRPSPRDIGDRLYPQGCMLPLESNP